MGESDPRETAKVNDLTAFRRARVERREAEIPKPVRLPGNGGGAWYHEAAMREEDRTRRP